MQITYEVENVCLQLADIKIRSTVYQRGTSVTRCNTV